MYTIKDAAQALGLHPKTLRRWEEKGKFTPLRTLGNQRRFTDKDLNFLKKLKAGEPVEAARPRILTLDQTAQKLQVNPATVQRWTKEGKLRISLNDRLEPGYNEAEIRQLLQGPTLQVTETPKPPEEPSRSNLVGKYLPYAGAVALVLTLGTIIYLWLQPKPLASPSILETQTPTVDVALPRTAQFLDGRITLGLSTGDLFYADSNGNLYLKNNALIDQGVYTRTLQLLPSVKPQENQIGQLYVDQGTGNLKFFDGLEWIDLNKTTSIASAAAGLTQSFSADGPDIDLTLGNLNASASATSLRITLAGNQSLLKVLGGAGQDILTLNDDALTPIILSQPTQILGNLTAPKLIDEDQTTYFLDPSSSSLGLSLAGEASISATLKFTKYGEFITNSVDDYLVFSGGIGIGGSSSYGFSSNQKFNARAGNVEDDLTVEHIRLTDNKIEAIDNNGLALYDDSSHGIFIADGGNVGIGTTSPGGYKLYVNGGMYVNGNITISGSYLPDYVFEPGYDLLSPVDLKEYIKTYQHLPRVPTRAEVQAGGLNITQVLLAILEKTEENTLYILDLYDKSNRIISPTVETEVLTTKMISPLADGQITIAGNASVSGTLYAQEINSSTIDRLREKISELAGKLVPLPAPEPAPIATETAILDNLPPATESGHLSLSSLESDAAFFKDYLAVLGQATFTDVKINNNLSVAGITGLAGPLQLLGQVDIQGNLTIAGSLEVKQINVPAEQDLAVNIASGSALSIYSDIGTVATFSGQTAALANLKLEASGTATIAAGTNNSQVTTDRLTDQSQVIITFTSDYTPATKYWVKKDPAASLFTLLVNYPVNNHTTFDWLIIN